MALPVRVPQRWNECVLPFWAVLAEDVRQALRHWAVGAWVVLATLLALVWLVAADPASAEGSQTVPTAAGFGARVLSVHLLVWVSFVIALGASSIPSEADIAPEAILCRGVSRIQYFLAKWTARIAVVCGVFLSLAALAILMGAVRLTNDLSGQGLRAALFEGTVFLAGVTAISVASSIWFRSPLVSFAVNWMGLYGAGIILSVLGIRDLAPTILAGRSLTLLAGAPWVPHPLLPLLAGLALAATLLSLVAYSTKDV